MEPVIFRLSGAAARLTKQPLSSGWQLQAVRGVLGVDHNKNEPAASPWIKVVSRPGDDPANRSEDPPAVPRPESMQPRSADVSDDVPEKNPDTQPQAPLDPEVVAKAEANPSVDSMRHMAGKLNEAVGGSYDFPKTGGASIRDMASEIGENIKQAVTGDRDAGGSDSKK